MLSSFKNRRSWLTQRLANRYPPWSAVRTNPHSIGQQIINHPAKELEDGYWQVNYNLNNRFLLSCDLQEIENLNRLVLPNTFEFEKNERPTGTIYKEPTSVIATLSDSSTVNVSLAVDNSLREFWYGSPTRASVAESLTYQPILPETTASGLSSVVPGAISNPGKLWLTLSGNSSMIQRYKGQINRAAVVLEGYDVFGKELKEKVIFTYNGKFKTQYEWEEITGIRTEYIDDSATIRIDWLPIGSSDHIDTNGLNIDRHGEKFRFFSIWEHSFGTALRFMSFYPKDFFTVQQGNDTKDINLEQELLDASGSNINASWLCNWPNRFYTVSTDGSYLHFHYPEPVLPDMTYISDKSPEAVLKLFLEKNSGVKNEIIYVDTNMTRPFWRVLKTRLSVIKPDGTRVGVSPDGSEIAFSDSGWVINNSGAVNRKTGYEQNVVEYTPTETGQYTFYLESMIKNSLQKADFEPIIQTDVSIYSTEGNTALSSVELPVSVGVVDYVAFDSYGQPWVINTSGTAYRLNFHYDYYLVNFNNKELIFREEYESVAVTQ